jgi:hypothetical protein
VSPRVQRRRVYRLTIYGVLQTREQNGIFLRSRVYNTSLPFRMDGRVPTRRRANGARRGIRRGLSIAPSSRPRAPLYVYIDRHVTPRFLTHSLPAPWAIARFSILSHTHTHTYTSQACANVVSSANKNKRMTRQGFSPSSSTGRQNNRRNCYPCHRIRSECGTGEKRLAASALVDISEKPVPR